MHTEDQIQVAFTDAILGAVKQQRYTHKQLASEYGMPYFTFRRYLKGERDMSVQMFVRVCRIIDVRPEEILRRTELALADLTHSPEPVVSEGSGMTGGVVTRGDFERRRLNGELDTAAHEIDPESLQDE